MIISWTIVLIMFLCPVQLVKSLEDIFLTQIIQKADSNPLPFKSSFDYQAFSQWKHMNMIEKLFYLLEYHDVVQFHQEYQYALQSAEDVMNRELDLCNVMKLSASETINSDEIRIHDEVKSRCSELKDLFQRYKRESKQNELTGYETSIDVHNTAGSETDRYMSYPLMYLFLEEYRSKPIIDMFWRSCDTDNDNLLTLTEYVICRGDYDAFGNPSMVSEYDLRANGMIAEFEDLMKSGKPIPGLYQYDENGIIID